MTTLMAQYSSVQATSRAIEAVTQDYRNKDESYIEMLDQWNAEMQKMQNVMGMFDYFGGF